MTIRLAIKMMITFHLTASLNYIFGQEKQPIENKPTQLAALVSVKLESGRQIIFNTPDQNLVFKNFSSKDSVVTRLIYLAKPLHVNYSNIIVGMDRVVTESGNLILIPGDTMILKNNGQSLESCTGVSGYVDTLLNIFKDNPEGYQRQVKLLSKPGLSAIISEIKDNYHHNQEKISTWNNDSVNKQVLHLLNEINRAKQIVEIPINLIKKNELPIIDSAYKSMLAIFSATDYLSSVFENKIFDRLIFNSARLNGYDSKDFWTYFDKSDSSIMNMGFFQPFVIKSLKLTYQNNPDALDRIANPPTTTSHPTIDTVRNLASFMNLSRTSYKTGKSGLDSFASGRYSYLLDFDDSLRHQERNLKEMNTINFFDINGKKLSFKKLIADTKKDIIVLDFWASWCIPCLSEFPALKKAESNLSSASVGFVGISIDLEKDKSAWMKKVNDHHSMARQSQYRLENPKDSPLNTFFNLTSIPRYIIVDKKGNIIDDQFLRPSQPGFEQKLNSLINNSLNK